LASRLILRYYQVYRVITTYENMPEIRLSKSI
jgi:hypothetical protein